MNPWIFIFLFSALLHLVGIPQPLLGNFAQHQTDYATVVQRWLDTSIHPLLPVMRFMAKGKNRIFLGDLPFNLTLTTYISEWTQWPLEVVGRGVSAFFFFLSLYPLHQLVFLVTKNRKVARLCLFFYTFSPLTLIYGQAFLLEMTALCFAILAYYFFLLWYYQTSSSVLLASALCFSLMLGTRLYFAPLLLPILWLLWKKKGGESLKDKNIYFFLILTASIPLLWQGYAFFFARAHGEESSLADNLRVFVGDTVVWTNLTNPRYFLPLLDIPLTKLVTPIGFAFALIGVFLSHLTEQRRVAIGCLLSFIPLFLLAPRKFIEFEYYYLPFVPALSFLAAVAMEKLLEDLHLSKTALSVLVAATILFSIRFSFAPILSIPDEDRYVLEAAAGVRAIVPKDARLIASHGSSTSFLYYCNRDGWAFDLRDQLTSVRNFEDADGTAIERLERFRSQGAEYFVLADKRNMKINPGFFRYLSKKYHLVHETPHSLIYSLRKR